MANYQADVAIVGAGITGLVCALTLLRQGQSVLLLERGSELELGGLARVAFGGMLLVDTPEQRRQGIADSVDIALADWQRFGELDVRDSLAQQAALRYLQQSRTRVYEWLAQLGVGFMPAVQWVERGWQPLGNRLPRYHILWGTGLGLINALLEALQPYRQQNQLTLKCAHQVQGLQQRDGRVTGGQGLCIAEQIDPKHDHSNREFTFQADHTVLAGGGYGGNLDWVRQHWLSDWGSPPDNLLIGAHPHADGHLHLEAQRLGAQLKQLGNMWNYAAGIAHPQAQFEHHGLSLIPPKSALWFAEDGQILGPHPLTSGFDTHQMCRYLAQQSNGAGWLVLNRKIAKRELSVSGTDYNAAIRDKSYIGLIQQILLGNGRWMDRLAEHCADWLQADTLSELINLMQQRADVAIDDHALRQRICQYDQQLSWGPAFHNDEQLRSLQQLRQWRAERLRTCAPQAIDDPRAGPLMAIRISLITRKCLGGIATDLDGRICGDTGQTIRGLYAAGEACGFGTGAVHGKRSLEGTFLASCIITGQVTAETILKGG